MSMKDLTIRKMKLEDLNPAKYNPRKKLKPGDKEYEKLKDSINNFGYVELIVINAANNNTVISGHQRLSVLKDLGETEVECVIVEMDDVHEKALNIAMNKVTGAWDDNMLALLLEDLQNSNFDLGKTGFDPPEIDQLFSQVHDKEIKEDDFDVDEELKQPAFSKLGDIWILGKHRVLCGDSTDPAVYEKLMDGEKANLLLTDPPYLVAYSNTSGSIKNDNLNDKEGYEFLKKAFECFKDNLSDDSACYVFYATSKSRVFYDAFEDAGFRVSCGLVWRKDRLVLSRTDYQQNFEPVIYGWKKDGKHSWYGDRKQTTCFDFDRPKSSREEGEGHPTSKPVPLMAYLIKQSTMTNGIVLDGFHGSGSTMIACEQLDRKCRAIELDEKFVDVQVKRYIKYKEGRYDDVYVIRDGHKLRFDEVATFEPDKVNA